MTYDHWKTSNPDDDYLGDGPDESAFERAEQENYAAFEKAHAAWHAQWPNACTRCGGWGGSGYVEMHGFRYGSGEQMFDPCEALGPEFCHRCGYEGFNEDHDGLGEKYNKYTKRVEHCCFWCGHNDDDGEPDGY